MEGCSEAILAARRPDLRSHWREGHAGSSTDERLAPSTAKTLPALRTICFAAVVMLVLEFGLGVGANLYATLPAADQGATVFPAFGRALSGGPIVVAVHAVLGTILLITGASAVVRASRVRQPVLIGITGAAFLSIVAAWLSGARFVGNMANSASLAMAIATGLSILCYVLVLFIVPGTSPRREAP